MDQHHAHDRGDRAGPAGPPSSERAGGGPRLEPGRRLTVRGIAPDGAPRWSFDGETLADDGDEIRLRLRAGAPVDGPEPWAWPADGRLHLWRSRYYSVLVTTRAGRFPYWYCAVHTPVAILRDELRVVDLGLDVQLFADGRYSVGGEDRQPAAAGGAAPLGGVAAAVVRELVALMTRKAPPFDGLGPI